MEERKTDHHLHIEKQKYKKKKGSKKEKKDANEKS